MKSKEALERLKDDIEINYLSTKHSNEKDKSNYLILLNSIEKDLEVLEILKPMLEIKKGSSWEYLDTKHCFFDTQEQIEIIKDWLENE